MDKKSKVGLAAIAFAVMGVLPATAAHADTTSLAADSGTVSPAWFGDTHITLDNRTSFGGWVDGNGPDSYMAYVYCSGGAYRPGTERWAGDRRGSFAYCPSGQTRTASGFRLKDV